MKAATLASKFLTLLIFFGIGGEVVAQAPMSDARFGTVGANNNHWQWWRGYNQDYGAVNLPQHEKRLWTVGKLDDPERNLGSQDWCTQSNPLFERVHPLNCGRSGKPAFAQLSVYERILQWDKEGIRRIIRAYNNHYEAKNTELNYVGATKIHFSIGNEPNWYPYVSPIAYAHIFKQYYDYIKGPGPNGLNCQSCVIHNGGIILANFWLEGVLYDILAGTFTVAGEFTGIPLVWRMYKGGQTNDAGLGFLEWTRRFLTELAHKGGVVDIFDAHAYDISIGPGQFVGQVTADPNDNLRKFISLIKGGKVAQKNLININIPSGSYHCAEGCGGKRKWGLRDQLGRCMHWNDKMIVLPDDNPCAYGSKVVSFGEGPKVTNMPYSYPSPVVWIDEFGVVKNGTPESGVISSMNSMVNYFKTRPEVTKWFWYKNYGVDAHFDAAMGLVTSPAVQLFSDENLATLTSVGQNYLSLQDNAYINHDEPRVSNSPQPPPQVNVPRIPQASENIVLAFDFNNRQSDPYKGWAFGFSTTPTTHPDGISWAVRCGTHMERTFSTTEMDLIKNSRYLVIERGNFVDSPGDFFTLTVLSQNGTETQKIISQNFGSYVNELERQGELGVVDLSAFIDETQSLKRIRYTMTASASVCNETRPLITYSVGRAYFTKIDPVPAVGYMAGAAAICRFAGLTTIRPDLFIAKPFKLPISIQKLASGCTLALDAASTSKGMKIDGQSLYWLPSTKMAGWHAGSITLTCGSSSVNKPFNLEIKERFIPLASNTLLLLDE